MQKELYLTLIVLAGAGLWYVWDQGIKKLLLDAFRERLFRLRAKLFALGMSGRLSFDSDAYRSIETLICGLLRFAHRVTLFGFVMFAREQEKAKNTDEYIDYHKQIELKISRTPPAIQQELSQLLQDTSDAVAIYMALSSLLFLISSLVLLLFRGVEFVRASAKSKISYVMESEAYREESQCTEYA